MSMHNLLTCGEVRRTTEWTQVRRVPRHHSRERPSGLGTGGVLWVPQAPRAGSIPSARAPGVPASGPTPRTRYG
jgi:hypothetical protein